MLARLIATVAALLLACASPQADAYVRAERVSLSLADLAAIERSGLADETAPPAKTASNPKTAPPARARPAELASGKNAALSHCHVWENWSPLQKCASMPGVYQWDGTRLAGRTNATGSTLGDYQHAYGWAISSREGLIRSILHTDVHGTPQLITDGTAAIAGWTRTDVWGNEQAQSGTQSVIGHTGYLKDPLLDELYAQARQYLAGTGRFTSRDDWAGDVNSPLSLNKYLYGMGNPGSYIDPDGRVGFLSALSERLDQADQILRGMAEESGTLGFIAASAGRVVVGLGGAPLKAVNTASDAVAQALPGDGAFAGVSEKGAIGLAPSVDAAASPVQTGKAMHAQAVAKTVAALEGDRGARSDIFNFTGQTLSGAGLARWGLRSSTTPVQLTEAADGGISTRLVDDLGQFERDMPTGTPGVSVAHSDAIKLNTKASIGDQGKPYEDLMESVPGIGDRLPPNFKRFDYFNESTGVATSVKTLDTSTTSRVSNPKRVYDTMRRDINKAANFEKYELQGKVLNSSAISERVVRVAVPRATNAEQWAQIQRAIQHGREVGVEVIVETVEVQ